MNQNFNHLPPSPFVAGTTYGTSGTLLNDFDHNTYPDDHEKNIDKEHFERLFKFPDMNDDRMYMRTSTTEQSLEDARTAYRASNKQIKDILNKYATGGYMRESVAAAAIRDNHELRMELGVHLLDTIKHMKYLPSRLNNDFEIKRPNIQGYDEDMTSKEYATLLALAMLDGTYKDSPGDKILIGSRFDGGEVTNGQHRYTAQEALGIGKYANNREQRRF